MTQILCKSNAKFLGNAFGIKDIYGNSKFSIQKKSNSLTVDIIVSYHDEKNVEKNISFEEIIELKDKALLLSKKVIENDKTNEFYEICAGFANTVHQVSVLADVLNKLLIKGYYVDDKAINLIVQNVVSMVKFSKNYE